MAKLRVIINDVGWLIHVKMNSRGLDRDPCSVYPLAEMALLEIIIGYNMYTRFLQVPCALYGYPYRARFSLLLDPRLLLFINHPCCRNVQILKRSLLHCVLTIFLQLALTVFEPYYYRNITISTLSRYLCCPAI
ncbi:hypothetical protein BATDEDRAFT_22232 [Batrachochytrium dendrobatidis JAM81]|uniref:Uncharacterized protein n=1 Tax=Batrachochytrium dendrobatidis (strain JAM81 / FGSC 10211) TaxID=684364 RepID=F4NT91_BATDJ|nr:uncharacterized protein BATDEDRAFT_22232 [Batrachochytrium dendrobatidis JAM81]EGF84308.1 hypothetical protein BATDEDRAFT_22232 [Batrachochytrium dendrobatidis JAM81]|eukprot:XP_006675507.1 hypothetical protein BATDEDRAFT_22232 [Batrachochytrium dendrobatidis JAM81]